MPTISFFINVLNEICNLAFEVTTKPLKNICLNIYIMMI